MDGRMSRVMLLGLLVASSGCVTTQEKKVSFAIDGERPSLAAAPKEEPRKPVPPRVVLAIAETKEREADAVKDNPEGQARLRDTARRSYQEVLKTEPDHIEAYRGLARVYAGMGDYERAQETYQKALAKHPRDMNLWYEMGMMHDRRKDWAEGAKCFRKALEIDPENQRCLKALGFTLARAGQIDQSVTYLTRAMGSASAAHCNVALMLLHLSEQEQGDARTQREAQARDHLRVALQENPGYDRARELLASMETPAGAPTRGTVEIQFAEPGQ
jgi:tetratricopeptide (TPR) repeat protein